MHSYSAALNKCPTHWINGICLNLGLVPKTLRKKKNKVQAIVAHLTDSARLHQVVAVIPKELREPLKELLAGQGV